MQRIIVQPPEPGAAALAELKHWLGISRPQDDDALTGLLATSLATCEAFTGKAPLLQTVEEIIRPVSGWQELTSRPVREVLALARIKADGMRESIAASADILEWHIGTAACVRVLQPLDAQGFAVQVTAGIAADWAGLPAPLRQGIIRLAAHAYRDRDGKASAVPPASVSALWRPWRSVRIA